MEQRAYGLPYLKPYFANTALSVKLIKTRTPAKYMNREQALDILSRCKPVLQERYGLTTLALFGSTARNDAREDSDIDILVGFDGKATSKQFFGVQFYLEEALGSPVDLVTEKAVREELKPYITQDCVDVFGYSNERGKVNG